MSGKSGEPKSMITKLCVEKLRGCLKNPERGCVVLDQPQHAANFQRDSGSSNAAACLRHSRAQFFCLPLFLCCFKQESIA